LDFIFDTVAEMGFEAASAFGDEAGVIEAACEFDEILFEFIHAHLVGLEINIEESAAFCGVLGEEASFFGEAGVEGGAGEGGEVGNLDVVEAAFADEAEDIAEGLGTGAVEAEDEAAIDGDAMALNFFDGAEVSVGAIGFPIGIELDAVEGIIGGLFEADEDLGATGAADHAEEFVVFGDGEVGFGEPADLFAFEGAEEVFGVAAIDESVVVGEFDEGVFVEFFEAADFGDDFVDGFDFKGGEAHGGGAELASEGATALGLDGEAGVSIGLKKIEAGHGGIGEIEGAFGAGVVEGLEAVVLEIADDLGPDGFAFADDEGVDVRFGVFGGEGGVEATEDDGHAVFAEAGG
jgi:hypothetical protein